jgi:adenylate cyclase
VTVTPSQYPSVDEGSPSVPLNADVIDGAHRTLKAQLAVRDGRKVPEKDDLTFLNGGGGVRLDATYAYADLANSSKLAQIAFQEATAKIIRSYVNTAARIFRGYGGEIRSYDGDRVMAIFVGDDKNTMAVRAALAMNWAVDKVLNPAMSEVWSDIPAIWKMEHAVGVATGQALIVRGGVFGNNDMISIGAAPNVAAKLSDIRGRGYALYITEDVYLDMADSVKYTSIKNIYGQEQMQDMWQALGQYNVGGSLVWHRGSTYYWEP